MVVPLLLLLCSAALAVWSLATSGPVLSDLLLLAAIMGLASLILLVIAGARRRPAVVQRPILVDGSNVLHWNKETPRLDSVIEVVNALESHGFTPGVMFDANVGYKIGERYQDDRALARRLGMPEDRVLVVPKGTQADRFLLEAARNLGAKVVTNDRFRDWAEAHPEVTTPGYLIRGGYRDGALWLDEAALATVPA